MSVGKRALVFAVLGLTAFWPVLRLGFQLDDHVTIEANPQLRQWSAATLHDDVHPTRRSTDDLYYRPLQSLVNRLEYTAWGLRPFGYHLVNLLLHIANAALQCELLLAVGCPPLAATVACALFVVHPIIVSELMMASGLPELLSLFFCLLALLALLRPGRAAALLGIGAYALALLAKESALALPLYYPLLAWVRGSGTFSQRRWIGTVGVTLAFLGLRAWGLAGVGLVLPTPHAPWFLVTRVPVALLRYALLAAVPWPLHAYRLIPAWNPLWAWGAAALAVALYCRARKPRWATACALWALLAFLPKLPLLAAGYYMLEHWLYPALIAGLLPLGVWIARAHRSGSPWLQRLAMGGFVGLLAVGIGLSQFYAAVRGTDEQNYRWSLRYTSASPLLFNLGLICLKTGRYAEAARYIAPVHALYPDDPNIAQAYALALRMLQ